MNATFDLAQTSKQVTKVLRRHFGDNAAILTAEGWHGRVHVKIVSDAFNGLGEDEKQEMIWHALREDLGEDAQAVSLVLAYGLDEI